MSHRLQQKPFHCWLVSRQQINQSNVSWFKRKCTDSSLKSSLLFPSLFVHLNSIHVQDVSIGRIGREREREKGGEESISETITEVRITFSYSWLWRILCLTERERVIERVWVSEVERAEQKQGEREGGKQSYQWGTLAEKPESGREKTQRTDSREVCRKCILLSLLLSFTL